LAPVLITQVVLMKLFFPEEQQSGHPLIQMVMTEEPDMGLLLLAGLAAVVVAPLCEEITFRLLLQGWLEKLEDRALLRRAALPETPISEDEARIGGQDNGVSPESPYVYEPPAKGVAGLPHGRLPILISAIAFGLAHYGYGPEPVPLTMLGIVLAYVYQRTHRIVPCIVAHALFNLFTMVVLWRMMFHAN
jgi:membrane protease YdiL (CAAX protease family)